MIIPKDQTSLLVRFFSILKLWKILVYLFLFFSIIGFGQLYVGKDVVFVIKEDSQITESINKDSIHSNILFVATGTTITNMEGLYIISTDKILKKHRKDRIQKKIRKEAVIASHKKIKNSKTFSDGQPFNKVSLAGEIYIWGFTTNHTKVNLLTKNVYKIQAIYIQNNRKEFYASNFLQTDNNNCLLKFTRPPPYAF